MLINFGIALAGGLFHFCISACCFLYIKNKNWLQYSILQAIAFTSGIFSTLLSINLFF